MHICHLMKEPLFCFSEVFKLCQAENINFVAYFVIGKHFFEQIFRKVEPESFLYEFLDSRDPLYCCYKNTGDHKKESYFFYIFTGSFWIFSSYHIIILC